MSALIVKRVGKIVKGRWFKDYPWRKTHRRQRETVSGFPFPVATLAQD